MKKALSHLDEILAAGILLLMTGITFVNVIARYGISSSISFTEELTSKMFVLFSLLGAAIAAKRRTHLGLTIITDMLPANIHRIVCATGYLLATAFCILLTAYGIKMTEFEYSFGQLTAGMQWPEWIFSIYIPIGSAVAGFRFAQQAVIMLRQKAEVAE